ncbi:MAG: Bro-N domain-containing protein [Acetobacter okinawensis]|uniref:BRO-N domain-containing protein n=1 Tax=Acetobacter okinawensis TaxID=1076594 RepID=UPI0039E8484E
MSNIIPFSFEDHAVRVITQDAQPWFVLSDVCNVLEHTNSRAAAERLDEDEKGVSTIYTPGGPQEMNIINESGLYNLIFTSRKPEAKRFRKWVTGEVLPSIRRTGSYAMPTDKTEWFNRFARILCLWDAVDVAAARQEWATCALPCPMPRKPAIRMLMEAALDLPPHLLPAPSTKAITNRHNGALGGRPRKDETPEQARLRRFHMVDKEVTPAPDGSSAVVVTYATHKGA